ncbi:MAG TPA: ABC transporter permease [Acidimicrobiales bacterium]|nr:ABC transporter permease [Acidimicrobiales bacterium]
MGTLILRRFLYSIPLLLLGSLILFWAVRTTDTFDPTARLAQSRDRTVVQQERERLGLDDPIMVQYGNWLGDFVTGDFGESSRTREDVSSMIQRAFGNTLQLIVWGVLLSSIVAMSIGVYSAVKQYSFGDYLFTGLSYVGIAMPPFFFAYLAIHYIAVEPIQWFNLDSAPLKFVGLHSAGQSGFNWDYVQHLILPVMTLTVQIVASWTRFQRAATLDVLSSDYIRTARAKGVPRRTVILRHGVRNSLIPLVTVMAVDIGLLFGGLIITEFIFNIPGMGKLFYDALLNGDAPVILAWMMVSGVFILVFNLLADVLYGVLDPRVRVS